MPPRFHSPALVVGKRLILLGGLVLAAAVVSPAAEVQTRRFDIPAGDARRTLRVYSVQSGKQLIYPIDQVRGVRTNPVRGELETRDALQRMLAGTELAVTEDEATGALAVYRLAPVPRTAEPRPVKRRNVTPGFGPADPARCF